MTRTKSGASDGANSASKAKTKVAAKAKPNWTVEEALEDGQAAVKRGSGLPLRPSAEKALFDHYRNYFEDQWKAGADWHGARERIMMLSQFVGALACLLTIVKNFASKRSAPVAVDAESAVQAAELVSWIAKLCWTGGWCPNNTPLSDILEEVLTQDLATLFPVGRLSSVQSAQLETISKTLKGSLGPGR